MIKGYIFKNLQKKKKIGQSEEEYNDTIEHIFYRFVEYWAKNIDFEKIDVFNKSNFISLRVNLKN
jgi:hypothetical protein